MLHDVENVNLITIRIRSIHAVLIKQAGHYTSIDDAVTLVSRVLAKS